MSIYDLIDEEQILLTTSQFILGVEYTNQDDESIVPPDEKSIAQQILEEVNRIEKEWADFKIPVATTETPGVVQIGDGLEINENGVISVNGSSYELPIASADTLGGVKVGDRLSIADDGALSAIVQFVDSNAEASATNYGKYRIVIGENSTAEIQVCNRTAVDGEENAFTYQWDTVQLYTLPAASSSTLGGIKVGSRLSISDGVLSADDQSYTLPPATTETLGGVKIGARLTITDGVLSADEQTPVISAATSSTLGGIKIGTGLDAAVDGTTSVKGIYQCNGTTDDVELLKIVNGFISQATTIYKSFYLKVVGDFGSSTSTVAISNNSNNKFNITVDFSDCRINNTVSYLTINTSHPQAIFNIVGLSLHGFFTNSGNGVVNFSNSAILYTIENNSGGSLFFENCVLCKIKQSDGIIKFTNCMLFSLGQISNGIVEYSNCRIDYHPVINISTIRAPLTVSGTGKATFFQCYIDPYSEFVVQNSGELIFLGCRRISKGITCNSSSAKITLISNVFTSSDATQKLTLGTDNSTIPNFYITDNKIAHTGITVGGSEVTYVTADNGHYMPEFSNKFATT